MALPDMLGQANLQLHILRRHRAGAVVDRDRAAVLGLGVEQVVADNDGSDQPLGHQGAVPAVEVRATRP